MAKGPFVAEWSATCKAAPMTASHAILDPLNLPKWFKGACDVEVDAFPSVGGVMRWNVKWGGMKSKFEAKVTKNQLPRKLVTLVKTPSGESVITNTFESDGEGTRYTKRVEVQDAGFFLRLMMKSFLRRSVKSEVEAACRVAEGADA